MHIWINSEKKLQINSFQKELSVAITSKVTIKFIK